MQNCRACTAPLPDDATACPACDEPVAAAPKKKSKTSRAERPGKEAAPTGAGEPDEPTSGKVSPADSDRMRPDATPSNEAMLALTAGVASCGLGFLPCLVGWFFLYVPAFGLAMGAAGFAIWRGTTELEAIREGTSPLAGQKAANVGRLAGFVGLALGVLMLVARIGMNASSVFRHR